MLFNSYVFIFIFLPFVLLTFYILVHLNKKKSSFFILLLSSFVFYFYWNYKVGVLILVSILFNFLMGYLIKKSNQKIIFLILGILINLSLLIYFKYTNFFLENFNFLFDTSFNYKNIFLPLAISFFTIQQIGYLIDVFEDIYFETNIFKYSLFVVFFPQLIAGPIIHIADVSKNLLNANDYKFISKNLIYGFIIFSIGFSKKILLADNIGIFIDNGFDNLINLNFLEVWFITIMYTFQMYFDFSGYSDMAVGLALMLNVYLPFNFKSPLKSTSIIVFWKTWHITLTSFLNTYIYNPIVKKNNSIYVILFAVILVFLISGLWHGSNWTFILWGFMNGIAIIINLLWKKIKLKIPYYFSWLLTFSFVCFSLICFRSPNIETYFLILNKLIYADIYLPNIMRYLNFDVLLNIKYGPYFDNILDNSSVFRAIFLFIVSVFITFFTKSSFNILNSSVAINNKFALLIGILFALSIFSLEKINSFIYFQF